MVCEFKIFIVCSTTVDYPENLGAIIGGVMGGFIVIVVITAIVVIVTIVCYRRYHHQQHQQPQPGMLNKSA